MTTTAMRQDFGRKLQTFSFGVPTGITEETSVMTWIDEQLGSSNPGWRQNVRRHEDATRAYTARRYRVEIDDGNLLVVQNNVLAQPQHKRVWTGALIYGLTWPSVGTPSNSALSARAYEKFVRKANKKLQSMKSLVTLGELGQTLRMLRNPARSLITGMKSYLERLPRTVRLRARGTRGSIRRLESINGVIAKSYLEATFGWKQLLEDMNGAAKALAERHADIGVTYSTIVATADEETSRLLNNSPFLAGLGSSFDWYQTDRETLKASVQVRGEISWNSSAPGGLAAQLGFTLPELIPTMWNLLPLSWVVDMFVGVGNILEAYAFQRSAVTWMNQTYRCKASVVHSGQFRVPPLNPEASFGIAEAHGSVGSARTYITQIQRTSVPQYTPVGVAFKIPGFTAALPLASLLAANKASREQIFAVYVA